MNTIELIEDLIKRTAELDFTKKSELDLVKRTADMRIRMIFGDQSKYLQDLDRISFSPIVLSSGRDNRLIRQSAWQDGKNEMSNLFNVIIEEIQLSNPVTKMVQTDLSTATTKIFVVHGHDNEMKQSTARTLEKLGLDPIILHEQANEGKTIIEKFLANAEQVSFAVVLLSPDDAGRSINSDVEKTRARQNVILELGFFIGRLGRKHVFVLHKGDDNFELPSDIFGVLYESYDGDDGAWRFNLAKELKNVGYDVDLNNLA